MRGNIKKERDERLLKEKERRKKERGWLGRGGGRVKKRGMRD